MMMAMMIPPQSGIMVFSTFNRKVAQHGRSGLEDRTMKDLADRGVPYRYEKVKVAYTKPESGHKYTPDFELENGIIIETKGLFTAPDRQKHLLVKQQHPELDIRFVFSRSASKITKGSKTSYADWCVKNGYQFSDKTIPQSWVDEPSEPSRLAAILAACPPAKQ